MPINPSIALQGRLPQFDNPLDTYAKISQLQGAQSQNKLADLMYREKERGIADESAFRNALTQAMSSGKFDENSTADLYKASPGLTNAFLKSQQDIQKAKMERAKEYLTLAKGYATRVMANPTTESAIAALTELQNQSGMDQSAEIARVNAMQGNPDAIRQWATGHSVEADKMLPKFEKFETGGGVSLGTVNPLTGQYTQQQSVQKTQSPDSIASNAISRANAGMVDARMKEANQVAREANDTKRVQDLEMKIGDDYRNQSKNFKDVSDAYKRVQSALPSAETSPAATLAAATSFMKLLDPGSVVRETELGMALAASGVFDRATNYFNTLQRGRVLTGNQVKDFKKITEDIYAAAQQGQKLIDKNYEAQAKQYKLRPEMIIQDIGQNARSIVRTGMSNGKKVVQYSDGSVEYAN